MVNFSLYTLVNKVSYEIRLHESILQMSYKNSIRQIGWGLSGIAEKKERTSKGSAIYL